MENIKQLKLNKAAEARPNTNEYVLQMALKASNALGILFWYEQKRDELGDAIQSRG